MEELLHTIRRALEEKGRLLVSIDGRCGCGKSSLAALLAERLGGNVFHMDEYYLPFSARPEGWTEIPAGNMDLSRFREEVLEPLLAGGTVRSRACDCAHDRLGPIRETPWRPLSIVEGSYSQHPALRGAYDLRLFVTASRETQEARLRAREGAHYAAFERVWIPMEENYFRAFSIEERADRVLVTD